MRSPKLTSDETWAAMSALEADIATRRSAALNDLGERIEEGPDAIDAEVPAMERALEKLKAVFYA
jgi:hypothetical protein